MESGRGVAGYGSAGSHHDSDPPAAWATRLLRLAHELAKSLDRTRSVDLVAWELAELAKGSLVAVYLTQPDARLRLATAAGPVAERRLEVAPALVSRAVAARSPLAANLGELGELVQLGRSFTDAIAAPIATMGDVLGVLLVATPPGPVKFQPGLLQTVADLVAASLANASRLESTREEARRDGLTGLENHRAFHEHLDSALRAASREGEIGLVLFDLDDFKQVNDGEGHQTGDRVLAEFAATARAHAGDARVFRIGGDEFALVTHRGRAEGVRIAKRIQAALADRRRDVAFPTLCAGVAGFPDDAATKDDLIHRADVALYTGKGAGKDRVVSYAADRVDLPVPALVAQSGGRRH